MMSLQKIMRSTFFNFSFDFSMAFTVRGLILFFMLICRFSHSLACEPYAVAFDKLLRALTMSSLSSQANNFLLNFFLESYCFEIFSKNNFFQKIFYCNFKILENFMTKKIFSEKMLRKIFFERNCEKNFVKKVFKEKICQKN